ncbi:PqiC family protein [Azospirillum sp. SYSU D00513]|uniref:PqiC family protein n=1 Tax=Azospirillum sp. SYSU D00513 TaxID=2812561 RepID=UPI001A96D4FB|nr:PqiC family protein [Azospirillum sp. SYSU D00513]
MNHPTPRRSARLLLLPALLGLLAGCGTEPSRFYTLAPPAEAPAPAPPRMPERAIGLEPVEIPDYLRRPEMVLRGQGSRLEVLEYDRWGGTLESLITRSLIRELETASGGRTVLQLPQRRDVEMVNTVEVVIERFEAAQDGPALLDARWRIYQDRDRPLRFGRTVAEEPVETPGEPGAVADALSRAVTRLARDIAAALPDGSGGGV